MKDKNTYIINGEEYTEWEPTISWRDIPKMILEGIAFAGALLSGMTLIYILMTM